MQTQLKQWGNSQGIRLSKEIIEAAGLIINENLDVSVEDGKIIISKKFRHLSLEERAAEYGGKLNLDGEHDWGEPLGREVW